jgi:hypothetical protein
MCEHLRLENMIDNNPELDFLIEQIARARAKQEAEELAEMVTIWLLAPDSLINQLLTARRLVKDLQNAASQEAKKTKGQKHGIMVLAIAQVLEIAFKPKAGRGGSRGKYGKPIVLKEQATDPREEELRAEILNLTEGFRIPGKMSSLQSLAIHIYRDLLVKKGYRTPTYDRLATNFQKCLRNERCVKEAEKLAIRMFGWLNIPRKN